MTFVLVHGIGSKRVNSFHNTQRMADTNAPSKHTLQWSCVCLIQVETPRSLNLFPLSNSTLNRFTFIPIIKQVNNCWLIQLPNARVSTTFFTKGIYVWHDNQGCDDQSTIIWVIYFFWYECWCWWRQQLLTIARGNTMVECAAYKKIAANVFWYTICVQVLMAWHIFGKKIIKFCEEKFLKLKVRR